MPELVETYVARRRFTVGDREVKPGDPVPEAESWRRPGTWVNSGHLAVEFREMTEEEIERRDRAVEAESVDETDQAAVLAELSMPDLRALAKEMGLKGFSKLKKEELVALIAAE
jgi:hypothetical protein